MDAGTKSSVAPTPLNPLNGSRWQRLRLGEPALGEGTDLLATFDAILNQVTAAQPPVQAQRRNSRDDGEKETPATNAVADSKDEEQEQAATQLTAAIVDTQPVIVVAKGDGVAVPAESEAEFTTAATLPQDKTPESAAARQQQDPRFQQQQADDVSTDDVSTDSVSTDDVSTDDVSTDDVSNDSVSNDSVSNDSVSTDSEAVLATDGQAHQAQTTAPLATESQNATRKIKREDDRDLKPLEAKVAEDETVAANDSAVAGEEAEGLRASQVDDTENALTPRGSPATEDSTTDHRRRRNRNSVRAQREVSANQNLDPARSRNAVPQAVLEQLTPVDPYELAGATKAPGGGDSLQLTNAVVASEANVAAQAVVQQSLLRSVDSAALSSAESKGGETKGVGSITTAGRTEGIDAETAVAGKRGSTADSATSSLRNEDRIRLIQRVSRAFQKLGNSGGQLHMMLHPSHLGSVRLDLDVQGRTMHATMTTQTANAAEVLEENIDDLRHRLEDYGIRVERIEIRVQETGSADRSQWQGGEGQRGSAESWGEQQSSGQRERGRGLERTRLNEGNARGGQNGPVPAAASSRNRTASGLDLLL